MVIEVDRAVGFEASEQEGLDEFFERDAVLEPQRNGNGETVHEAAKRRPFLVHVEKDFSERSIVVFTGAEIDFMPADHGLLRIPHASRGKRATFGEIPDHHPFRHLLGHLHDVVVPFGLFGQVNGGVQGLAQFGPVPIQGHGLEHMLPPHQVRGVRVPDGGIRRHVNGLADCATDKRLCRGHHPNVRLG